VIESAAHKVGGSGAIQCWGARRSPLREGRTSVRLAATSLAVLPPVIDLIRSSTIV
jgi:hypothetical protein